jgi:hypothetical protein
VIFTSLYLAGAINPNSWHAGKGDFTACFSSRRFDGSLIYALEGSLFYALTTDREHLSCGGFSLSEIVAPAPATSISCLKNTPITQAMMMIPPWSY